MSDEAQTVGLCATCCRHPMPLASGGDVEALAQRLERDPDTYHAASQATVVFLAPHTEEGYSAIPVWVIPTCGKFKADHCHAVRKHMAELCGNAAFRDRHAYLLSADTDGDARRSREMQAALYGEGASTLSWMPEIPHIPFQTDELGRCGNFDPPHLMKRVSRMFRGASLVLQGELSYGVLQELHNHCDDPKPVLPPLPQDKQEVEPAFVLLKSMPAMGLAALDSQNLPPPLVHAAGDAVVLGTALEKFIGGVYNTELPPTVAVENIAKGGYILYLIQLRSQPFRDCWYLHFVRTVQAFLVIPVFLQWHAKKGCGAQSFFACLCGNQRAEDGFCLVRTMVINRNCSVAELALRLSAALVVATIYSRHPTWQQKRSRHSSIDRARPRHYTADMDISRVDLASLCQRAADRAQAFVCPWLPATAYRDPKECTFFEPSGVGLQHVDPDHVWVTRGDSGGGQTEYDVDTRAELYWEPQRGRILYEGREMHIMSAVNLCINGKHVRRSADRLARTAGIPVVRGGSEPTMGAAQLCKGCPFVKILNLPGLQAQSAPFLFPFSSALIAGHTVPEPSHQELATSAAFVIGMLQRFVCTEVDGMLVRRGAGGKLMQVEYTACEWLNPDLEKGVWLLQAGFLDSCAQQLTPKKHKQLHCCPGGLLPTRGLRCCLQWFVGGMERLCAACLVVELTVPLWRIRTRIVFHLHSETLQTPCCGFCGLPGCVPHMRRVKGGKPQAQLVSCANRFFCEFRMQAARKQGVQAVPVECPVKGCGWQWRHNRRRHCEQQHPDHQLPDERRVDPESTPPRPPGRWPPHTSGGRDGRGRAPLHSEGCGMPAVNPAAARCALQAASLRASGFPAVSAEFAAFPADHSGWR